MITHRIDRRIGDSAEYDHGPWYVVKDVPDPDMATTLVNMYLHRDGVWRYSTAARVDGKEAWLGYYDSSDEALAMLHRVEGPEALYVMNPFGR